MPEPTRAHDRRPQPWPRRLLAPGLLGLNVGCWILPWIRGQGPYAGGHYGLIHIYVGVPALLCAVLAAVLRLAPSERRRPLALRLGTGLAAALLALGVLDLATTVWTVRHGTIWHLGQPFPRRENLPDPELVWKRRPGLVWTGRKTPSCDVVTYRTDEDGFRNPPGSSPADIVFLGDSVTEAGEVEEGASFVRRVGDALGVRVRNLGVSGYGPQQELVVLERHGLACRPRLVVWQVTEWNDVLDAQAFAMRNDPSVPTGQTWGSLYAGASPLARLVATLLPPRLPRVGFQPTTGPSEQRVFWPYQPDHHRTFPQAFETLTSSIATAQALCRERGIAFVVLYVPSHTRVLAPYLRFSSPAQRARYGVDRIDAADADLACALAWFCRDIDCPLIDLFEPLRARATQDNRRLYVRDDPHLGIDGHDEVSRVLVGWLRERGWPELPSGTTQLARDAGRDPAR